MWLSSGKEIAPFQKVGSLLDMKAQHALKAKSVSARPHFGWSIALGVVAFLGAGHILIRTSLYRVDYHTDPGTYVADAKALAAGKIFEGNISEGVLAWWPPFYPLVLSLYRLLGVEAVDIGRYVNIASFGLIILVAGHWVYRFVRFRLVVAMMAITIAVSYPLVRTSSQLFSETLFILLSLLALTCMGSFLSRRKMKSEFWLSTIFSSLALLTRYIGITVIFTGALLLLTHRGLRIRWKQAALYSVASSLPTALWITRNQIVNGTLTARQRSCMTDQPLWDTLTQFGDQLHLWIFVREDFGWLDICLWVAIALVGFQTTKASLPWQCQSPMRRSALFRKVGNSLTQKEQPVLPFATFAIVYTVILFIVAPYTTCEPPTTARYLLPVYVPVAITAAILLERSILKTYQSSGVSIYMLRNNWGISYDKSSGPMATVKWIIIGLILTIILVSIVRNIYIYIYILITYDPYRYQF